MSAGNRTLGIVDSHVHFVDFDQNQFELAWPWGPEQFGRRWSVPELQGCQTADLKVTKWVHIEAAHLAIDPVEETRWLETLRESTGVPHAAIARAGLGEARTDEVVKQQLAFPFVRGIRDAGKTSVLNTEPYISSVARLGELGLLFELYCTWRRFHDLAEVARRAPGTTIVLEHVGLPPAQTSPEFSDWRRGIKELASQENIVMKLSGFGMAPENRTHGGAAEIINVAMDAFGIDRCVWGSNFPVDGVSMTYAESARLVLDSLSLDTHEAELLFRINAESLYRI